MLNGWHLPILFKERKKALLNLPELLINYHTDSKGNIRNNGKLAGGVFKFTSFKSLNNEADLFFEDGTFDDSILYEDETFKKKCSYIISSTFDEYISNRLKIYDQYFKTANLKELFGINIEEDASNAEAFRQSKKVELTTEYLLNDYIAQYEMSTYLYGVPSEYENNDDFLKRIKHLVSPISKLNQEIIGEDLDVYVFNDIEENGNMSVINEILASSDLNEDFKDQIRSAYANDKNNKITITDGAMFTNVHKFCTIIESMGDMDRYKNVFEKVDGKWKAKEGLNFRDLVVPTIIKPFA